MEKDKRSRKKEAANFNGERESLKIELQIELCVKFRHNYEKK
jgi:hypothetical protein